MPDISGLSDDDLKAAYQQPSPAASAVSNLSDDDLQAAYDRSGTSRGLSVNLGRTGFGAESDAFASPAMGHVLTAFGQGASNAWEHGQNLGYSDDVNDFLRKQGIYNDVAKGQGSLLRTYNEAFIRPLVAAGFGVPGAIFRGIGAAVSGGQGAAATAGEEVGLPGAGRTLAGLPEAFPLGGHELGGLHVPPLSVGEIQQAAQLRLVGAIDRNAIEGGPAHAPVEDFPAGHVATVPAGPVKATLGSGEQQYYHPPEPAPDPAEALPAPPSTVHEAARAIAPDTFAEFDALDQHKQALRGAIADATDELQRNADAQAPHAAEIADLERRLADTTPRLAKKYQARLDELTPARDAFANSDERALLTRETDQIQGLRQELQRADYRQRDLAPQVSAAYREAGKQFPESQGASIPPAVPAAAEATPPESSAPVVPAAAAGEPAAPAAAPIVAATSGDAPLAAAEQAAASPAHPAPVAPQVQPRINIADDVSKKLTAAGRPADEANASAQIIAAHYEARAARFEGARGTAEDLYRADAPDIRAARAGGPDGLAGGQFQPGKGATRSLVTLFDKADASTFGHESAHAWLGELLSDAAHPLAPDGLKADAATVRDWLGATDTAKSLTRGQQEKFARGFEQYLMAGIAPSQRLAGVFAQFRNWLRDVYQSVKRLGKPISADIQDVFHRLIEADPQPVTIASDAGDLLAPLLDKPKPTPVFERVPQEPKRLIQSLIESRTIGSDIHAETIPGGLKDPGGDISAIIGGPRARPGLINNRRGVNLDDATLRAHQEGYFPEHDQRPEINDLLNKIAEDHNGNPQYSMHDQEAVEAYHGALARNDEIDRLASEHGIEIKKGTTREQFFNKLADKLSADEHAALVKKFEDAQQAEFDEIEPDIAASLEPSGSTGQSRTLEDLENENRQEAAAAESPRHAESLADGSVPAGRAGPGEAGGGSGGDRARDAGRGGAQDGSGGVGSAPAGRSDEPAGGRAGSAGGAGQDLVDKAGNIRLDNLNSTEDVKQALRDLAAQNDDFRIARGGVVSDVARREMADALGLTPDNFDAQKPPGVSPSVWAEAVQKLTFQASDEAAKLGKAFGETGTPEDGAAYLAASQRFLLVADHFSTLTAEAGRTLRVFDKSGIAFAGDLAAVMQRETSLTLYQMQQQAKAVGAMGTVAQRAKMLQDVRDPTLWQKLRGGIISLFINNLISGPLTHAGYAAGNQVWATFKATALTAAEASLDSARVAFGAAPADRVYFGEIGAQIWGMQQGAIAGFSPALKAASTGISYMEGAARLEQAALDAKGGGQALLPGMSPLGEQALRPAAIGPALEALKVPAGIATPAGYVLETPSRGVSAIHTLFYGMNYSRDIARRAFRMAANEGRTGDDFATRVADLTQDPPLAMVQAAHDEALSAVLMKSAPYGSDQSKLMSVVNNNLPAKLIIPFMQIGLNILDEGLVQSTPIGLAASQLVRDNLAGRNGEVARSQQYARIIVGTGLVTGVMGLAQQGLVTGSGPADPRELALWEADGNKPYSVRIGDANIPYRKYLGPIGDMVGAAANIQQVGHLIGEGALTKAAGSAVLGFSEVVADESWLSGVSNFLDAMRHYDTKGETYFRNLALNFLPGAVGLAQMTRVVDPYQRAVHSWTDALVNHIPVLSQGLYPQRDWTGAPITSHTSLTPSQALDDPTIAAMQRAEFFPSRLARKIDGVPLTDQQYDDYARLAGQFGKQQLDALVPNIASQPIGYQQKIMEQTLSAARKFAADTVKLTPGNENITRQALAAMMARVTGGTRADVKAIRQSRDDALSARGQAQ